MGEETAAAAAAAGAGAGPAAERLVRRTCGWCGAWVEYAGRGPRPKWCSKGCRNRAWEVRSAERRLGRDLAAGRVAAGPVREVVSRPRVPAPAAVPEWIGLLDALAEQLRGELGRRHWTHARLYDAVVRVAEEIDRAHPGGLDALDRRRRR